MEAAQLLHGLLRHPAGGPEGVGAAHQHRVLLQQVQQVGQGEEGLLLLMGFQAAVQLQDGLQGADGEDVPPLGHVGLHPGEDPQAVGQLQAVPHPAAHRGEVAVEVPELEGVEVLGEAQASSPARRASPKSQSV